MSTDDLIARVRDHLAHADTLPHGLAIALVSELADEVDRLRAEADRYRTLWDRHGKNDLLAERDAARAALERVRAIATLAEHGASGFAIADALTEALEGKPS